jgi:hypothetical protein
MPVTELEKAIFRTLAYFAYFQLPLTHREVHLWLLAPDRMYSRDEVEVCLTTSEWLKAQSDRFGVYVSLKECADWVREREKKYRDAERKHAKARRAARWMMSVPGVEGIAVCNSLAWNATHGEGDIDFFIVTKPGKVWSARLCTNAPLKFLGMRPGEAKKDPICLSFFADTETLNFSSLKEHEEDWYLAYWIASLKWIAGPHALAEKFWIQNNWIKEVLPHAELGRVGKSARIEQDLRIPFVVPEAFAKYVQEQLFSENIRTKRNQSTHVIINDRMLKFHDHDRRAAISAFVRLHMQQAGV